MKSRLRPGNGGGRLPRGNTRRRVAERPDPSPSICGSSWPGLLRAAGAPARLQKGPWVGSQPKTPTGSSHLRPPEKLLGLCLLLQGDPDHPSRARWPALTMTAAGRGRVPPAPFPRSSGRQPGRGGAQLRPLRPWRPRSAARCLRRPPHTAPAAPPAPMPGRTEPAARAPPRFYNRPKAPPRGAP